MRLGSGRFTGTGPFYGGAKFEIGPMALVTDEASGVSAVLAAKRIQAADQEMFRHVGVEPSRVPILALKSTVHFRADFQPIAETILVVQSPGAHVSDPVEMPYKHLRPGIRLRPLGPESSLIGHCEERRDEAISRRRALRPRSLCCARDDIEENPCRTATSTPNIWSRPIG